MKTTLAGLALLFWSAGVVAAPADFVSEVSGTITARNLAVRITPSGISSGMPGQFFVCAYLHTRDWYCSNRGIWQYLGPNDVIPTHKFGTLLQTRLDILQGFDVSEYTCSVVYAGYGLNANTMLADGTYARIYTASGIGADGRLCYADKVYTTRTGGAIFGATKTGLTTVRNMTEFQTGATPLGACSLYEYPVENGIIPVTCQVSVTGIFRKFYIDPVREELHTYVGSYVFDESKFHMVPWGTDMPYAQHGIGTAGSYAEVADGIYYAPGSENWTLKLSNYGFTITSVIATGSPGVEGNFNVVMRFSNP